jgi:hypothetical protein
MAKMIYAAYAGGPGALLYLIADPETEDHEYWVLSEYDPPGAVYHGHVGVRSFHSQTEMRLYKREWRRMTNNVVTMAERAERVERLPEAWGLELTNEQRPKGDLGVASVTPRLRKARPAARTRLTIRS